MNCVSYIEKRNLALAIYVYTSIVILLVRGPIFFRTSIIFFLMYNLFLFFKWTEGIKRRRLKLYRAALNGDWAVAKGIYDVYEGDILEAITAAGDTALHVAAVAKRIGFAKELVKIMKPENLAKQNEKKKCTALVFAAASGKVELAREMMDHNKKIATIRDEDGSLPIQMAASLGHKDMVEYLYEPTKNSWKAMDRFNLLLTLVETELYGKHCP